MISTGSWGGTTTSPSAAIEVGGDASALYERLLRRGVITRPLGAFGLKAHLRVTVGLPEENERFIEALRAELAR